MTVASDGFSRCYESLLRGLYDCTDRIVLNAYYPMAQSGGGFRAWWRKMYGSDETLDDTHLMRLAGRFSRRARAWAKKHGVPFVDARRDERKHEIAERYRPTDPKFRGIFLIIAGRAPAPLRHIRRFGKGGIEVSRKCKPYPYVTHYSFHLIDPQWGHVTIKVCGHPPFDAQVILNGHEQGACVLRRKGVAFRQEENCFTELADDADLAAVAETLRSPIAIGLLRQVCDRWLYSACLCFVLSPEQQKQCGFYYEYSVYQGEYSRNLLFDCAATMERLVHALIDRASGLLHAQTVRAVFGYRTRPHRRRRSNKRPRFEVVIERPTYDLVVIKLHYDKLTLKIYTKGEHVLRIESTIHNARMLKCGNSLAKYPRILEWLRGALERFLDVVSAADASFVDTGQMDALPAPSCVGTTRVGGVDVNRPRMRAVLQAVVALSWRPDGFTSADLAAKVREIQRCAPPAYTTRQASYDLKKLRGKALVQRRGLSRRYEAPPEGLRVMVALVVLREKVIAPLLAGATNPQPAARPATLSDLDAHYRIIQTNMKGLFHDLGIAA